MLWDETEEYLVVRASHGLADDVGQQPIPKDAILEEVERVGGYQPVFTPRLSHGDARAVVQCAAAHPSAG